jgi:hypothetical protein
MRTQTLRINAVITETYVEMAKAFTDAVPVLYSASAAARKLNRDV